MIWTIFLPLLLGFIIGYILKHPPKSFFFWIFLLLLLFFVGHKTGKSVSNLVELRKIMSDSLVISLASIAGSIAFVVPLWRRIR